MGSRTKFWFRFEGDYGRSWLFKYPRCKTGEHWAEKIAAEVAELLEVPHAKVELAEFDGNRGSATESFVRGRQFLIHGNQILDRIVNGYDHEQRFHQSSHTLENILDAIDTVFVRTEISRKAKIHMGSYLVLDALIGNTDRHHENWGILLKSTNAGWNRSLAPSYDHASSLGRELMDERRDKLLAMDGVGRYVENGRGAVYWSTDGRRGPSPLELVRIAVRHYPEIFSPALERLDGLDESSVKNLVERVPADWMTTSARAFAMALIGYNLRHLREIVR